MAQKKLYFAYGENMNVARLKKWLFQRGGRPDGIGSMQRAVLSGYKLVFNVHKEIPWKAGIANLEASEKGQVEGVLMEVDNTTDSHIQRKEGFPASSKRIDVSVIGDQEKEYDKVTAYLSTRADDGKSHAPTKAYMDLLLEAAGDFEFSDKYVSSLKKVKTT
jgi:hypothetical protein